MMFKLGLGSPYWESFLYVLFKSIETISFFPAGFSLAFHYIE